MKTDFKWNYLEENIVLKKTGGGANFCNTQRSK